MNISHLTLRNSFAAFWKNKKHVLVPPAPLVPTDDPTAKFKTLFTTAGMQQLVSYLSGQNYSSGKRLYNIQPCFRAVDIDEVGNNRHSTFFEMMGNWSLGDYFKEEQLAWIWEFFTKELGLEKNRLYITLFDGDTKFKVFENGVYQNLKPDVESKTIWTKLGVLDSHISFYGADKNWWSIAGSPDQMPIGQIGGPDSEIFYDFGEELKLHEQSEFRDNKCHINCDCGRFLEIGNSVFIQYIKTEKNLFEILPQKNVDFGGGLERLLLVREFQDNKSVTDLFLIDIFRELRNKMIAQLKGELTSVQESRIRIFLDHSRSAIFLISEGVRPGKNKQEYIVRRLIRRADDQLTVLKLDNEYFWTQAVTHFKLMYQDIYSQNWNINEILSSIINELRLYGTFFKHVEKMKEELFKIKSSNSSISTASAIAGPVVFRYQTTYGVPGTVSDEIVRELELTNSIVNEKRDEQMNQHKNISRTASVGMFKGGLADHSEQVLKYHTATHLLHQALRDVLGEKARQDGSNITAERLRFDFSYDRKPTEEEIKKVEEIINQKIKEGLAVEFKIMPKEEAEKIGALSFFKEKYADKVKVYFVGNYSKEFCGGPHVKNTSEIGEIKVIKVEKIGANLIRVYAK